MLSFGSDKEKMLLVGYALIVYGIVKIILCMIVFIVPHSRRENVPFFEWLSPDATLSGHVIEVALFVFGCYTLLHGMSLVGYIGSPYATYIDHVYALTAVYGFLGVFMIVFFGLVAYTNLPIPKDTEQTPTYEIVGIGGGITFIVSLFWIYLYCIAHYPGWMASLRWSHDIFVYQVSTVILLVVLAIIVVHALRNKVGKKLRNELITLVMLPLAAVA
jgi:hypothetical protein